MLAILALVASLLAGECGPVGPDCEMAVARTVANRVVAGASWADVADAYHGRGAPTTTSLALAAVLVQSPEALADGRHVYAYSDQDCRRMGWRAGDERICGSGYCVHLSATWPGR